MNIQLGQKSTATYLALFVGIEDFLLIQFNDCGQNILISAIKTTGYALSEQKEGQETSTTKQI